MNVKRFPIIGTLISAVKQDDLEKLFSEHDYSVSSYICISNVHTVVEGRKDKDLQFAGNNSWLSLADGKPLSVLGNILYGKKFDRIVGHDLMMFLLDKSEEYGFSHLFFGSTEDCLDSMKLKLSKKYSNVIKGYYSPPFKPFSEDDLESYFSIINDLKPTFIWVSLGAPKQEKFMASNISRLDYGVMVGVGAAFDYIAGKIERAPKWMQRYSLEWLFRLYQEPGRLWKRYLVTNTKFLLLAMREILYKSVHRKKND